MSNERDAFINSIMNNPKIASVLHDAYSAPIGSTKRAKAKSILSIIKKTSPANDGQGGYDGQGGITLGNKPTQNPNSTILNTNPFQFSSTTPSNPGLFSGLTLQGTPQNTSALTGVPTTQSKGSRVIVFPSAPALKSTPTSTINTSIDTTMKNLFGNNLIGSNPSIDVKSLGLKLPEAPKAPQDTSFLAGGSKPKADPMTQFRADVAKNVENNKVTEAAKVNANTTTTKTTVQKSDGTTSTTVTEKPVATVGKVNAGTSNNQTSGTQSGATTQGGSTSTTPEYASMLDVYNAAPTYIKNNLGAEYYAQEMMKILPEGQITALEGKLKEELGLNALLDKKTNLESLSPKIQTNLVDYVKARDLYIKDINNMIDKVDEKMMNTDTSNPSTAAMYKNYRDYLYTLKGRQNQRYADYVNKSIEEYNTDLTNTQNKYSSAVKMYEDAKKDIENKYDDTKKVLLDMYKTIEEAPGKQLTKLNQQMTYNKLLLENADAASGRKNWLPEVSAYKDLILDSNGDVLGDINLAGKLQQLSGDQKYNPVGVISTFTSGAKSKLSKEVSSSDPNVLKNAVGYATQIDQAYSLLNPETQKQLGPQISDMKQSLIGDIGGTVNPDGTGTGITGYILQNYKGVNSAVKQLSGKATGFLGFGSKPVPSSRAQFIKDNPSVNADVLGAIYDSDQLTKNQLGANYNIVDGLKAASITNNTSGGDSLVGLPQEQQLAKYLTARILEPMKYANALNN